MKTKPKISVDLEHEGDEEEATEKRGRTSGESLLVRIAPMTDLEVTPNEITSSAPGAINVKPEELWVDREYQRNLSRRSRKLIHSMVTDWDWAKFKPPVLTRDEKGRYLIIDGQHTAIGAATHPEIKTIPAMFIPMQDMSEQAKSFIGHNTARIPVVSLDLWHARIAAEDPLTVQANEVLSEFGISVVRTIQGSNQVWRSNQTVATAVITRMLDKHGLPKFRQVVEFISKCSFSPIKADHWRFAEALLISSEAGSQSFVPSMMLEVIKAHNATDALTAAMAISRSIGVPVYRGMLVHYRNLYNKVYRHAR